MKSVYLFAILCGVSLLSFAQPHIGSPLLQKFTTLNTVKKLNTSYYHKPVMVLIGYNEKVSTEKKKTLFAAARAIGFTDTALMVILPQYPGTKLKDSIKQVCSEYQIGSIFQMNLAEKDSDEDFLRVSTGSPMKKGINIIVNYMGWNHSLKEYIQPCVTLYYHIDEPLKDKFLNAVPANK